MELTAKQMTVMRGFARHNYLTLSASEAGDPEIQAMFDDGIVTAYWGSGVMWHLTRNGRELAAELGLLPTADQLVIDAASGTVIVAD